MAAVTQAQVNAIEIVTIGSLQAENAELNHTITTLQAENAELRRRLTTLPLLASLDESHFSCSSFWDATYGPSNVRVITPEVWHPANGCNYSNQWIEVDLGREHVINAIELHGRGHNTHQQYVTRFEIHHRRTAEDDYTLLRPLEGDPSNQFLGVKNTFAQVIRSNFRPFRARYVRLVPREFVGAPTCKWELHGYVV